MFVYSVFDVAAGTYGVPMLFNNDALAVRWFRKVCSTADPLQVRDARLYCIATFDDASARFGPASESGVPVHIVDGTSFLDDIKKEVSVSE